MQEMQETWVQFLGWEDPLKKGMATHSSILAWKIPWTEEPHGATNEWAHSKKVTENILIIWALRNSFQTNPTLFFFLTS